MSREYDKYISEHRENVKKGYDWLVTNLPHLVVDDYNTQVAIRSHDDSKSNADEYVAYDAYFYGGNKSFKVVSDFKRAWLTHIHRNPHHWQYWILRNDDPNEGVIIFEIPYYIAIEMICDWWSFSWKTGNLLEIVDWYEERKEYIQLHENTRRLVENILYGIKMKLDDGELEIH